MGTLSLDAQPPAEVVRHETNQSINPFNNLPICDQGI
jgi:hypothetical protein